ECLWGVVGEVERRVPVEALGRLARGGPGADAGRLAGLQVAPPHVAVLALAVDDVGVSRIDPADEAVPAEDGHPVLVDDPAAEAVARAAPAGVVLQPAVDAVRPAAIHAKEVALAPREGGGDVPVVPAVR